MTSNLLPKSMNAVCLYANLPIADAESLLDLEVSLPSLRSTDVLVEVKAISVNGIDTKQRCKPVPPTFEPETCQSLRLTILSYLYGLNCLEFWALSDGSGVIVAKGEKCKYFNVGDEVLFIADLRRNGPNAQYVAIDEIMVGLKPKNITFEEAAAVPWTGVTAYESLYDRLPIFKKDKGKDFIDNQ